MKDILLYEQVAPLARNFPVKFGLREGKCYLHWYEHYLCRLFKSQMGKPPMQYLNEYRVEKACALLENTTYSVTDAALAVGFDDASYFARVFKKQKGVSPRNYRKKE